MANVLDIAVKMFVYKHSDLVCMNCESNGFCERAKLNVSLSVTIAATLGHYLICNS